MSRRMFALIPAMALAAAAPAPAQIDGEGFLQQPPKDGAVLPDPGFLAQWRGNCERTFEEVRTDGTPTLTPRVDPTEAMTVLAVDYAVDDCHMLVSDAGIHPVPLPPEDGRLMRPAQ